MTKPTDLTDGQPAHSLDELAKALPPPADGVADDALDAPTHDALVATGAQIASGRVVTDGTRIYAQAYDFWQHATDEQKELLVGFSPELLALAVHKLVALRALADRAAGAQQTGAAQSETASASADQAFTRALKLRDHAYNALRQVAGRDPAWRAKLDATVGTAPDAEALARGVDALATLGRELLAHKKDAIATRARLARLNARYLDALAVAGKAARDAARSTIAATTSAKNLQGELDLSDGINLHLLGEILHAFDAAHELDATIPRLVPIATRRLFGRHVQHAARAGNTPGGTPQGNGPQSGDSGNH